jgi:hypothetical protein
MSDMLKVAEVLAESNKSWRRSSSRHRLTGAHITKHRINAKVSFLLEKKSK